MNNPLAEINTEKDFILTQVVDVEERNPVTDELHNRFCDEVVRIYPTNTNKMYMHLKDNENMGLLTSVIQSVGTSGELIYVQTAYSIYYFKEYKEDENLLCPSSVEVRNED